MNWVLTILTAGWLWWQGLQPTWNAHLQVDIWVFWERINYWLVHNHSFAGLTGNEVLPSALLYLFIPAALVPVGSLAYANYLPAAMLVNMVVLAGHWFFYRDKAIFWTCLLALGPILLFRFDGLVTLLMLFGGVAFIKRNYPLSGFFWGLATATKVFPVIVVPYMLLILMAQRNWREMVRFLIGFGEALLLPVIIFVAMGGDMEQVSAALAFHSQKLISIESIPGSWITGWSLLRSGVPPAILPGNGIWAVAGPAELLNRLWIVPVALFYYLVWKRKDLIKQFNWSVVLSLLLVFLAVSKNLNPQYLWWYAAFLPLTKPTKLSWVLTLGVLLLNQLVFPLYYTLFVENFYRQNESHWIFYLLLLRNVGLVAITYLSLKQLFSKPSKRENNP